MTTALASRVRVLLVSDDDATVGSARAILRGTGDDLRVASSMHEAITAVREAEVDVALVDVAVDHGAAVALAHHLTMLAPGAVVHAIVRPETAVLGTEALSLGATSLLAAPLTGDAVLRVVDELRTKLARDAERRVVTEEAARVVKRQRAHGDLVRRLAELRDTEGVRALVDAACEAVSARGVALYGAPAEDGPQRRIAASGTSATLPLAALAERIAAEAKARGAACLPLRVRDVAVGTLVVEDVSDEADRKALVHVLSLALALVVPRWEEPSSSQRRAGEIVQVHALGQRLLALAGRHQRRLSVLVVHVPRGSLSLPTVEDDLLSSIRATDAAARMDDETLAIVLPETGALGAQACRRRLRGRLFGERRARPHGGPTSAPRLPQGDGSPAPTIGLATFPHDGSQIDGLLEAARQRALATKLSVVHALGLAPLSLADLVDELIEHPMFAAGAYSTYPLDVASQALFALATQACHDAGRGGAAQLVATAGGGLSLATAARRAFSSKSPLRSARVVDVRAQQGCDDVEAAVLASEHGVWVCCGRVEGDRFRGVHSADPLLADVVAARIDAAGRVHAG